MTKPCSPSEITNITTTPTSPSSEVLKTGKPRLPIMAPSHTKSKAKDTEKEEAKEGKEGKTKDVEIMSLNKLLTFVKSKVLLDLSALQHMFLTSFRANEDPISLNKLPLPSLCINRARVDSYLRV